MRPSGESVYLFAGDSLTEGVYGESYVERIARILYHGQAGLAGTVVNAGRGGDTVQALLDRIEPPLRDHEPDWVVLAIGANDVWLPWLSAHSLGWRLWFQVRRWMAGQKPTTDLDQFAAAYRALIDRAQTVSGARVLACTVSPVGEQLSSPVNRRLARLNGAIKDVAADCRVPVADVWQAFVEELAALPRPSNYVPGEWLFTWLDRQRVKGTSPDELSRRRRLHLTFDGLHLNSRGADLWAKTVLTVLAQAQGATEAPPSLARQLGLPCAAIGPIQVCHTPGWETRARDLGRLLAEAYEQLASLTSARPTAHAAVLTEVDWQRSGNPMPYPVPCADWDGEAGTVFVPQAYSDGFLREMRLPETLAVWTDWPPALAHVGGLARATALADLLAVEQLAHLFLRALQVAPADPQLGRLFAAYLTHLVLHARQGRGAAELAAAWDCWAELLAQAGLEEGQARQQAEILYEVHGANLAASLASRGVALRGPVGRALDSAQPTS